MRQENRGNGKEHLGAAPETELDRRFEVVNRPPAGESDEVDVAVPFSDHEIFSDEANETASQLLEVTTGDRQSGRANEIYDKVERILSRPELTGDSGAMRKVIKALNN